MSHALVCAPNTEQCTFDTILLFNILIKNIQAIVSQDKRFENNNSWEIFNLWDSNMIWDAQWQGYFPLKIGQHFSFKK